MSSSITRTVQNAELTENLTERRNVLIYDGQAFCLTPTPTAQRDTIFPLQKGLIVFNQESNAFEYYDGFVWQPFGGGGGGTVTNALNGTLLDGTTVKLGGELLNNTEIPGNNLDLDFGIKSNKLGSLRVQHKTAFSVDGTDSTTYPDETYKTAIAAQTTDGLVLLRSSYDYIPTLASFSKEIRLDTRSGEQGIIIIDTYDNRGLAGEVLFAQDGSDEQYMQYGHVAPIFEELRTYYRSRSLGGGGTLLSTDLEFDRVLFIVGLGATTINLPAFPVVSGGRTFSFRNLSDSTVTIQADSGTLVESSTTLSLLVGEGVTLTLASFDNNYYILK